MEEYFKHTKAFLGILQANMTEGQIANSAEAADAMFEAIRVALKDRDLNMVEMLNAATAVCSEIMDVTMAQMEKLDKEEK